MTKATAWVAVLVIVLVAIAWLILQAGHEWAEALVQGLAALGGLGYFLHRNRPLVTLRLRTRDGGVYIELANVSNRIARQVTLSCDPPIALHPNQPHSQIGLEDQFGDMDRGQRHTLLISFPDGIQTLQKTDFYLSHDRGFGLGRRTVKLDLGGSGWNWTVREDAATTIDAIANSLTGIDNSLQGTYQATASLDQKTPLPPPPRPIHDEAPF